MPEISREEILHNLPPFIVAPGGTDWLLVGLAIALFAGLLFLGNLYFTIHSLPEKLAHGTSPAQLQLVGILALLALFTHNNLFWVIALLLAAIKFPDFTTPLQSIADSLARQTATDAPAVATVQTADSVTVVVEEAPIAQQAGPAPVEGNDRV